LLDRQFSQLRALEHKIDVNCRLAKLIGEVHPV
jgi:hypothetical protein